jgi:HTH-type transcriptional regulator, transcriptional repressor of NAD biosynthesis genes
MTQFKTGLFVGSFSPPHLGHVFVAEFARRFVDELFVVLCVRPGDSIEGAARLNWLRQLMPDVKLLSYDSEQALPQWLKDNAGTQIDHVFGSDSEAEQLAKSIAAHYVPVDPSHTIVPIAGEAIRSHPLDNWRFLPMCVRPHYLKRICVFGPESTGKSTLTINLAKHFDTVSVPEWPRTMISQRKDELFEEDFVLFARGQCAAEDALAQQANRVLFSDTDPITTYIWADWLYGRCDKSILQLAETRKYHLYLLTSVDVPWVADPQRYLPEEREKFFDRCKAELEKRSLPYEVISGSWEERFAKAVRAVEKVVKNQTH